MRVVFMGTPEFAVPTLEALIAHHEVIAVVTQPDKPKGRGKAMACPPVKETAMAHDIPVYQPVRVREESFVGTLRELQPDVIVVVAFGQILPESILNIPPYGCINVHASLLPRYRGAAPMQWAIINGEKETGVTIMHMAPELDAGDIILQRSTPIAPDETALYSDSVSYEYGVAAAEEYLRRGRKQTAAFVTADVLAVGLVKGLLQHGLRIPEDLSVVGFDDVYLSRICYPSLTTVHQDIARKGAEAVRLIMEAAAGVQERMECILPLTLVERDSVMERRAR